MKKPDSKRTKQGNVAPKGRKTREWVKKWGKPVIDAGYTAIPSVLVIHQKELKLDALDMCILLQLIEAWWKADRLPFHMKATIADRVGRNERTVQRRIAALEKRGLIKRIERAGTSNEYDLNPLADKLHPLAVKELKEKKAKRETAGKKTR